MRGQSARARRDSPLDQRIINPSCAQALDAAGVVFNRQGFAATTIADIANEAGVPESEVLACFEDTHDVLAGLIELVRREADELFLITMPDELSIVAKLRLLLAHQAEWGNRRQDVLSFFGRSEPHKPRRREQLDLDQHYLDGTIGWFERHRVAEELDLRVPAEMAAHVFRALQIGFFERWISRGGEESFLDTTEHVLDIFLNGVPHANGA